MASACATSARVIYARRRPEETSLYQVFQSELSTFLEGTEGVSGPGLPRYVSRELRGFTRCGILAAGFVRARCEACGQSKLVAFSCGARAVCPSCGARRMAEQSAHLVDEVLPDVPLRQWVLTVPWPIRRRLAADGALMRKVLGIFVSEVFRWLAETTGAPNGAKGGAVAVTQRFGGTLNLHVHYHVLVLDGVYTASELGPDDEAEGLVFHPLVRRVTEADERCVAERVYRRMLRLFRRRGWIDETGALSFPDHADEASAPCALGLFETEGEARFEGTGGAAGAATSPRHESRGAYGGFSVHAGVTAPAGDKARRERLCRYVTRPAFASEQVERLADGRVRFELRRPRASQETHLVAAPDRKCQEFGG